MPAHGELSDGSAKLSLEALLHPAVGVDDDGHGRADAEGRVKGLLVLVHQPLVELDAFAMPRIA